jgi:anti-anti-sigma factor
LEYNISEGNEQLVIKISGQTRNNEALKAKRLFSPYLRTKGVKVMIDLGGLSRFEPASLLGVLSSIRKEVHFRGGELRLCSLSPETQKYFTENRLDRIFRFVEEQEKGKTSKH